MRTMLFAMIVCAAALPACKTTKNQESSEAKGWFEWGDDTPVLGGEGFNVTITKRGGRMSWKQAAAIYYAEPLEPGATPNNLGCSAHHSRLPAYAEVVCGYHFIKDGTTLWTAEGKPVGLFGPTRTARATPGCISVPLAPTEEAENAREFPCSNLEVGETRWFQPEGEMTFMAASLSCNTYGGRLPTVQEIRDREISEMIWTAAKPAKGKYHFSQAKGCKGSGKNVTLYRGTAADGTEKQHAGIKPQIEHPVRCVCRSREKSQEFLGYGFQSR